MIHLNRPVAISHAADLRPAPTNTWFANVVVGLLILAGFQLLLGLAQEMSAPRVAQPKLDRSLTALPAYALLTLARGGCAYLLSLLFAIVCGTVAAHDRVAERLLIPLLDVLQAIPVLGFLPGLVLVLVQLSPRSNLGLEIACILMIFTGQVWNMTFSYYASLRGIPQSLHDVAAIEQLSRWQILRHVELPSATIGLIWNSMISMAGGWFFLTVTESFTLEHREYQLPGIGSYMNMALRDRDWVATAGAIVAMLLVIISVDQLIWRPLIVWSQRFRMEEVSGGEQEQSRLLNLLHRSSLARWCSSSAASCLSAATRLLSSGSSRIFPSTAAWERMTNMAHRLKQLVGVVLLLALLATLIAGTMALGRALIALPLHDPQRHHDWLTTLWALLATSSRTTLAVVLAAAWTIPAGILIGRSPKLARRIEGLIQIIASFPAPMLFPLVTRYLVAIGLPFSICCVLLLMLSTQWYILFNTIAGAQTIPTDLCEVVQVFGLSRLARWRRLYLPSVFPSVVTGLLTATGAAWNATIVAEVVTIGSSRQVAFGLGSLIAQATTDGDYPLISVSVTLTALTVVTLNQFFWKRLYRIALTRYPGAV